MGLLSFVRNRKAVSASRASLNGIAGHQAAMNALTPRRETGAAPIGPKPKRETGTPLAPSAGEPVDHYKYGRWLEPSKPKVESKGSRLESTGADFSNNDPGRTGINSI